MFCALNGIISCIGHIWMSFVRTCGRFLIYSKQWLFHLLIGPMMDCFSFMRVFYVRISSWRTSFDNAISFPQVRLSVRKGWPSPTRLNARPPTVRVLSEPTAISPLTCSEACATIRLSAAASPTTSCARLGTGRVCQRSTAKPRTTITSLAWLALLMPYVVCQTNHTQSSVARACSAAEVEAARVAAITVEANGDATIDDSARSLTPKNRWRRYFNITIKNTRTSAYNLIVCSWYDS